MSSLPERERYWPDCKCGHAASSHGMTGAVADNNVAQRGGRYLCRCKNCTCDGYDANEVELRRRYLSDIRSICT